MNPQWIEPWPYISARLIIERAIHFDSLSQQPLDARCVGALLHMVGSRRLYAPGASQEILQLARLAGVADFNSPPYDAACLPLSTFDQIDEDLQRSSRLVVAGGWIVVHGLRDSASGRRRIEEWLNDRSLPHVLICVGSCLVTWRNI